MADIDAALTASQEAIEKLIVSGERCGPAWAAPRARGKWSPSQIVEHVARSLEESANMAAGRPSKFPRLPALVHPLVRALLFRRVLRKGTFPKARTNQAMNPARGPATAAEGRVRLEAAHQTFAAACRQAASRDERMRSRRPSSRSSPSSGGSTPKIAAAISERPAPTRPAKPRISPWATSKLSHDCGLGRVRRPRTWK